MKINEITTEHIRIVPQMSKELAGHMTLHAHVHEPVRVAVLADLEQYNLGEIRNDMLDLVALEQGNKLLQEHDVRVGEIIPWSRGASILVVLYATGNAREDAAQRCRRPVRVHVEETQA